MSTSWYIQRVEFSDSNDVDKHIMVAHGSHFDDCESTLKELYVKYAEDNDYDELYDDHHLVKTNLSLNQIRNRDKFLTVWRIFKCSVVSANTNPDSTWIMECS